VWESLIENELLVALEVVKPVLSQRHWRKLFVPPFRKDLPWGAIGTNTPLSAKIWVRKDSAASHDQSC